MSLLKKRVDYDNLPKFFKEKFGLDNLFFGKEIRFIIYAFFIFQLLSLLGYFLPFISAIVFLVIILATLFLAIHKIEYGFLILIFEFFAGHGGHLFEFADISLRTALYLIVILIWLFKKGKAFIRTRSLRSQNLVSRKLVIKKPSIQLPNSPVLVLFLVLLFLIIVGVWQGVFYNDPLLAIKDLINYSYIFLIFPLVDLVKKKKFINKTFNIVYAGTISIAVLTIIVLALFATGIVEVHDSFYWWWRSVAIGKATFTNDNFFRIVTPAHLLVLPLFLVYLSFLADKVIKLDRKKKKKLIWLAIFASLAILINFSRAYFLGFFVGLIFLGKNLFFRRWLIFALTVIIILVLEFGLLFTVVSGGKALTGLTYFKERMHTLVSPEEETSSLTRMVILPNLIEKIKQQPVFGRGLGSTVSYIDPVTSEEKTTFHIDWGYLEIWLELGLLALLIYISILGLIIYSGLQKIKLLGQDIYQKRLIIGLLAGMISIAVATLTGPFLFHPLGIFYLTFTAAIINNKS